MFPCQPDPLHVPPWEPPVIEVLWKLFPWNAPLDVLRNPEALRDVLCIPLLVNPELPRAVELPLCPNPVPSV